MCNAGNDRVLKGMRKRSVPDIMKKYCNVCGFFFLKRDFRSLAPEGAYCHFHQMQCPETMLKTGVIRSRINKVRKTQLLNISKPLVPWMLNQVKYKIARDAYKSINRIIDNLSLVNLISQLEIFNLQK